MGSVPSLSHRVNGLSARGGLSANQIPRDHSLVAHLELTRRLLSPSSGEKPSGGRGHLSLSIPGLRRPARQAFAPFMPRCRALGPVPLSYPAKGITCRERDDALYLKTARWRVHQWPSSSCPRTLPTQVVHKLGQSRRASSSVYRWPPGPRRGPPRGGARPIRFSITPARPQAGRLQTGERVSPVFNPPDVPREREDTTPGPPRTRIRGTLGI